MEFGADIKLGFGLTTMKERILAIGGQFSINSSEQGNKNNMYHSNFEGRMDIRMRSMPLLLRMKSDYARA